MKLVTWNVNGIRACIKKGFLDFLKKDDPDIICLQEVKAQQEQVDLNLTKYNIYWNSATKKGYSGTAIFSKIKPLQVIYDIPEHNDEGRVITLEYENFFLINVYVPNSKRELLRLDYRQKWDKDLLKFMKNLEKKKSIVLCGDLNVAHNEIDLKNPNSNHFNPGFSDEERKGFSNFLEAGFLDVFREKYPDKIQYTWWSYMFHARDKNIGWRLDYFLISKNLLNSVKDIVILEEVLGSDHCPVELIFN